MSSRIARFLSRLVITGASFDPDASASCCVLFVIVKVLFPRVDKGKDLFEFFGGIQDFAFRYIAYCLFQLAFDVG